MEISPFPPPPSLALIPPRRLYGSEPVQGERREGRGRCFTLVGASLRTIPQDVLLSRARGDVALTSTDLQTRNRPPPTHTRAHSPARPLLASFPRRILWSGTPWSPWNLRDEDVYLCGITVGYYSNNLSGELRKNTRWFVLSKGECMFI